MQNFVVEVGLMVRSTARLDQLLEACKRLVVALAEARVLRGYRLAARFVIHAVGPVYQDGRCGEPEALRSLCSAASLIKEHRLSSVAFAALSTGVYGYPSSSLHRCSLKICDALRDSSSRCFLCVW